MRNSLVFIRSFNTQPPEGGWPFLLPSHKRIDCFNTQPPEGGWPTFAVSAKD